MRSILLLSILLLLTLLLQAQKTLLQGRVYDSSIHKGLAYTTVSLVHAKDSTLVSFTRADTAGFFKIAGVEKGRYLISASYVGYIPVWKPVEIAAGAPITDMGYINLHDIITAGNVVVNTKRPPVVINNDTLEFNTENFVVQPNAVVEDMLKKMPGVMVEKDGTVKVNGQTVRRVLVNGKEFFTGDVKMATQNLPADAVDKVQVFDKKSDQAAFTGMEDGNSEKTINLKFKKDKDNALFGKLMAGMGGDKRYDVQASVNKFRGNEQLSFLGMSNNTNRQGFQLMDVLNFTGELSRNMRNGGGMVIRRDGGNNNAGLPVTGLGQNQQGIATTTAGGINYNNTWNNGKTNWNASYMGSNISLVTNRESNTQYILPGNSFNRYQQSNALNDNIQHRVNMVLDQVADSTFSFKVTPFATWQHSSNKTTVNYTASTVEKVKLNDGYSNTSTEADAFDFTNNMLFRKKFKKKGRTVSLNATMAYNHSSSEGALVSNNIFYAPDGSGTDSLINQVSRQDAITRNFGARLVYTEPVGKKSLLELSGFFNTNIGSSDKTSYDYNSSSGKHDRLNTTLSNNYRSSYTYSGGGINYRANRQKVNITAGLSLQAAVLNGVNDTYHTTIKQQFADILPNLLIQYNISRMKNIRLEYSTATVQPGIIQLQPVADISDPLNISTGNPGLKRQYNHSVLLNIIAAKPDERKNLFGLLSFTSYASAIVPSDSILQNGTRISSYANTNGTYNIFGNLEYDFPLRKLKSRFSVGTNVTYSKGASFINSERNTITSFAIGPNMSYHFGIDHKIDLDISASLSVNSTGYGLQQSGNNNYLRQNYGISIADYLPWGMILYNDFNYVINTGRAAGFNTGIPLWNASLAKGFLKNRRGEVKFNVMDLLGKNTGITRSSNEGYIADEKYNVLQRYFLLSLTYSLTKSGLNSGPKAVIRTIGN